MKKSMIPHGLKESILIIRLPDLTILSCSESITSYLGYAASDLINKPAAVLFPDLSTFHFIARHTEKYAHQTYNHPMIETEIINKSDIILHSYVRMFFLPTGEKNHKNLALVITEDPPDSLDKSQKELSLKAMRIINDGGTRRTIIEKLSTIIQERIDCNAIAIRLKNKDDYSYFIHKGYPKEFTASENSILDGNRNPECLCGAVITGGLENTILPITLWGSFWTNNLEEWKDRIPRELPQIHFRGKCCLFGFQSIALIPLRHGSINIGILQIGHKSKGFFTPDTIQLLEEMAGTIGIALSRLDAEDLAFETAKKYKDLVLNLNEGIWLIDETAKTIFVNPKMAEMLGYTEYEMHGKHLFEFMDDEWKKSCQKKLERRKNGIHEQHDFEFLKKDGSKIYTQIETAPMYDSNGSYNGALAGVVDISARKKAEEMLKGTLLEKEALLQEVHHRVKNNLQIISALLWLEAKNSNEPNLVNVLRNCISRVDSIALIHNLLYQDKDIHEIKVKKIVDKISQYIFNTYRSSENDIRLSTDVDDISIPPEKTIPIGLLLTELLSNSFKYAFPGGKKGNIRISLKKKTPKENILIYSDDGIGLQENPAPQQAGSLGIRLINDLAKQLKAQLIIEKSPGVYYTFLIPA